MNVIDKNMPDKIMNVIYIVESINDEERNRREYSASKFA